MLHLLSEDRNKERKKILLGELRKQTTKCGLIRMYRNRPWLKR